jgi:hypothetical protein
MLEDMEDNGCESIVSWLECGRSFKVHRPRSFVQNIIPSHSKQIEHKSFQRQVQVDLNCSQNQSNLILACFLSSARKSMRGRPVVTKTCDERKAAKMRHNQTCQKKQLKVLAVCKTCKSNADTMTLEHDTNKQLERLLGAARMGNKDW